MNKKTIALAGVTTAAIGVAGLVGLGGLSVVSAQDNLDDYPLIIQNLAEKFGVGAEEVKQVFEDTRTEQRNNRLTELVEDGKITEDQKNAIIEKMEEVEGKMEEIRNTQMTVEERHDAMQELREELEQWAEDNGIDIPLGFGMGMGKGRGMGAGMGEGMGFGPMEEM